MHQKLKKIFNQYITSFPALASEEGKKSPQNTNIGKKLWGIIPMAQKSQDIALSEKEKIVLAFKQLAPSPSLKHHLDHDSNILDDYAWHDLNLIAGNYETPQKHILNQIKRTKTAVGTCVMATEIVTPQSNPAKIKQKQAITQHLCQNDITRKKLEKNLDNLKQQENTTSIFWSAKNPLQSKGYKEILDDAFYKLKIIWHPDKKSSFSLSLLRCLSDFLNFWLIIILAASLPVSLYFHYTTDTNYIPIKLSNSSMLFYLIYTVLIVLFSIGYILGRRSILLFVVHHLATIQTYIKQILAISKTIKENPILEDYYGPHLAPIRTLLEKKDKKQEVGRMIHLFKTLPLNNFYYFWHSAGKVLALNTLWEEHKDELSDVFYIVGKLDAQLSIVRLLIESQATQHKNTYTLSDIQENPSESPHIHAEAIWHPALDSQEAVSNNLTMNAKQGPRMMIITGPNTGGKSTYILSSGINIILSQAFGIAAAKSFQHTTFAKIITYVNPIQNIASGLSLAEAGFEVLRKHKTILESTNNNIIAIVDEILNGVDPEIAATLSYEILETRYQKYPNCLTMITTHYKQLTTLEKLPHVINKKVDVTIPGQFKPFDCTYKIVDGISQQNIVRALLEFKGVIDSLK